MDKWAYILTVLVVGSVSAEKPTFACYSTKMVLFLQPNVEIQCTVRADPAPDQFRIYWTSLNYTMTLQGNSSRGPYHAYIANGLFPSEKIMTLRINRIFGQHFRTYNFEAGNDQGKTTHYIELTRDPNSPVIDRGVALGVCWVTILACTIAVITMWH